MTTYFMARGILGAPHVENTAYVDVREPGAVYALCGAVGREGIRRWPNAEAIDPKGLLHCPDCRRIGLGVLFEEVEEELAAITEVTGQSTAALVEYLRALGRA